MAEANNTDAGEIWKPVVGYEGLYEVSNRGRIKSLSRFVRHYRGGSCLIKERLLKSAPERSGHFRVKLCRDGAVKRRFVHQVVLEAFVGPCPSGLEGCHEDGKPSNNTISNLRWDTRKSNAVDSIRHGTQVSGERHHKAKLSSDDVIEIRRLGGEGLAQSKIAKRFGVSKGNVQFILNRKSWSAVPCVTGKDK